MGDCGCGEGMDWALAYVPVTAVRPAYMPDMHIGCVQNA